MTETPSPNKVVEMVEEAMNPPVETVGTRCDEQPNSQAQTPLKEDDGKPTQRDLLVACADNADLWHDGDSEAYASIQIGSHTENHRLRSRLFRDWLARAYYNKFNGAPSAQATEEALRVLEAKARFDGPLHETAVRVGEHARNIYIDLADTDWRAIEVTPSGWNIVSDPPVHFIRPKGMRPLPIPTTGGSIATLRQFVNVATDEDFKMLVAWLLMALKPKGPYPILVFGGEQGAAKSTTARVLRALIDPNSAPLRSPPREERDLLVAARNSWAVSFDNLSRVPEWLADALCRLATGGGYSARQLYSDADEVLFEAMRPMTLNGIPDLATRPDVADRAIIVTLPQIPKSNRKPEKEFWRDFDAEAGGILGALLDAVSCSLSRESEVSVVGLPRMADFALWVTAAEPALGWAEHSFIAAYRENLDMAIKATVEADLVADAVRALVQSRLDGEWRGSATELFALLNEQASDSTRKAKEWPKAPNALGGRLRRAAPGLREMGIDISDNRVTRNTCWTLIDMQKVGEKDRHDRHDRHEARHTNDLANGDPSQKTAMSATPSKPLSNNDFQPSNGGHGDHGDVLQAHSTSPGEVSDAWEADL